MNPVSADLLTEVEDRAVEMCMQIIEGVVELMQADGHVYGDEQLSREERILAFLAMVQSGEFDALSVVNPELAAKYQRDYFRDVGESPVMRGGI